MQSPAAARRYPDPAYPDINCVCTSDHCSGVANSPGCNGLSGSEQCRGNTDDSADGAAALDGRARDADANCFTAAYLDAGARCCGDPGDCQPDAACLTP